MVYNLKELAQRKAIVYDQKTASWVPAKGFIVVYDDDDVVNYISRSELDDRWEVESPLGGTVTESLRTTDKSFRAYKEI